MSSRKSVLAVDALRVYDLAKSVARDPRNAAVAAHVKNMKRDLNRNGRPKKKLPPLDVRKAAKAAGAAASAAIIIAAAADAAKAATPTPDPHHSSRWVVLPKLQRRRRCSSCRSAPAV